MMERRLKGVVAVMGGKRGLLERVLLLYLFVLGWRGWWVVGTVYTVSRWVGI
jgi:hypothetical protein